MAKEDKNEDAGRKDAPVDKESNDATSEGTSTTIEKSEATSSSKARDKAGDVADTARERTAGVPPALPVAAGIIGIIGLILAGVLYFRPGLDYTNEAYADRASTDEVATVASENAKQLVGIDYEALDEYVDNLPDIMTPGLEDELMKNWDQLADTYTQAKTKVDVSISDVGVTYLEENRAEVLIAQSVSVTQDGQAAGSTDGTYLVRLEKIDGDWKLSSVPDLPS